MVQPKAPVTACLWPSPIGTLLLAATDQALCGVWFEDQSGIPAWALLAPHSPSHPMLERVVSQLSEYLAGERRDFDLPLDWSDGTTFQQTVWQALAAIPYGHTLSYSDIAQRIGKPLAVRAVGGAVGRNPLGIIVPCHRVVGRDGSMTGYTGGMERKIALLKLEAV